MIPKVKTWRVTVVETGEVLEIDTITKKMVKIILALDYPRLWGKQLTIGLPRQRPMGEIVRCGDRA